MTGSHYASQARGGYAKASKPTSQTKTKPRPADEPAFDWDSFLESENDWIRGRQGITSPPDAEAVNPGPPQTFKPRTIKPQTPGRKPMANYSPATLDRLAATPIKQLTDGQLRSARKHKARQVNDAAWTMEAERLIDDNRQRSLDDLYEATGMTEPAQEAKPEPEQHPAASMDGFKEVKAGVGEPKDAAEAEWLDELPRDLIERAATSVRYADFAASCKAHKGKWRLWREYRDRTRATSAAGDLRRGHPEAFAGDGFDARAVENPKGVHRVYVSYKGEKDAK